ncbi:MAG: alpha-glucosidase [Terracidiphilus sp.]|jgi:alpha-glucosidase
MTAKDRISRKIITCTIVCLIVAAINTHGQTAVARTNGPNEQEWWENAVIYEIYPRSFQDTNGDGVGDLDGITKRLDYLKELGVDAIWLTPCYPSPQVDFGYDISDYENIDPQYGTMADFDRLVAEAGKRHIRVIMDMVMNHTSDQHAWFLQSRSSRSNPYRDWYVWHDGKEETSTGKSAPPNNWQSEFGHSAWQWDEKTRQYYYHKFYIQQPDLNWDNPAVHRAFKDIMDFWLKRGVAGFRFDAISSLFEDPGLADEGVVKDKNGNPLIDAYGEQVLDGSKTFLTAKMHPVMQEMRAEADAFNSDAFPGDRVLIAEIYTGNITDLARMYGPPGKPEFQLPMDTQVGFIDKLDVAAFRAKLTDAETGLGSNVPLLLFDNHDNPRIDMRYGDGAHDTDIQRVIATLLFASRGAALFYYGDEIGMKTTSPERREDVKDPIGIAGWPKEKGRDGERTPMQWDATTHAGFTTGMPWLPVPPSAVSINVKAEEGDPDSLLTWYEALIRLKKSNRALEVGASIMLDTENTKVLSWMRQAAGAPAVVVSVNLTAQPQTVKLANDALGAGTHKLKTLLKTPGAADSPSLDQIQLGPFGVYVGEVQ